MPGDFVRANFGSLADGEAQFVAAYNGLSSTVNNLDSQLRGSLATWDGQARDAYYQAKAIWDRAMADMGQVISGLSSVIGTANANYQSAESTNAAMFGS
jgi:WXG100 family type VII secretion target